MAVREYGHDVTLVGDPAALKPLLEDSRRGRGRLRVPAAEAKRLHEKIHVEVATQVVGMDETPLEAIRKKKGASICVAFDLLKQGRVDAVASAGNSGATLAAAVKSLGRLKNIARPGIAGIFPTLQQPLVMMDVGANVDCRPNHLFQFAVMGAAFSQIQFGIESPRIGLLSIGEEGGKGNALVKQTHELLKQSNLNYIGNVEGKDTFQGNVDVIVCDGFVGNVCLKLSEGLAEAMVAMLRDEIAKNIKSKVGYLLTRDAFSNFKKRTDYAEYGGAPLLGCNGAGIICHGRSNALAIKNAVRVGAELVRSRINDRITAMLDGSRHLQILDEKVAEATGVPIP